MGLVVAHYSRLVTKLFRNTTMDSGDDVYITHRWNSRINHEVPAPSELFLSLPSDPQPLASLFEDFARRALQRSHTFP
jgi:hypothetical protein